jgi:hypothetical protein
MTPGFAGITPLLRIGGTDYLGSGDRRGRLFSYLVSIFETSPATSAAWTGANVNALEAGWKLTT